MTTSSFSLHYVQTADDMRAEFRRMRREGGRDWSRLVFALLMSWLAINSVMSGYGWLTSVLTTLAALYFWISPAPLIWLFYLWALKHYRDLEVSIEIDERSLVSLREGQKYGYRQYWSRLSRIEETDRGFEFAFDRDSYSTVQVPLKAFVDDAQRHQFREFLTQHAPPAAEWHGLSDEV